MLLNSFFFIENIEASNEVLRTSLRLEKDHPIFIGHFPNLPVVPGVCMIQMVKEILERVEGKRLFIDEASNIKFLSVLNPNENNTVDSSISIEERVGDSQFKISATITNRSVVFFKMKATLRSL